ncbi:MAG: hypothetical protein R2752_23500, partial [Vicinamibacterales bacterium]
MSAPDVLPLRTALFRGAAVTLVNWPVIVAEFAVESVYKLALLVPVLGGAFMVAAVLGADIQDLVADGLRETVALVLDALRTVPAAFAGFVAGVGLVAFGGCLLMFVVKAGTLSIVAAGEQAARPEPGAPPGAPVRWSRARRVDLGFVVSETRHFAGRAVVLASGLAGVYAIGAAMYLTLLGLGAALSPNWTSAWPVLVLLGTGGTVVGVTLLHLVHDLLRLI